MAQDATAKAASKVQDLAAAAGASAQDAAAQASASAQDAAQRAVDALPSTQPAAEKERSGGFLRFLLIGIFVGAIIAIFSRRGDDEDEDFGEENWIEVKHDETGPVAAAPPTSSPAASSMAEATPSEPAAPKDKDTAEE